MLMFEWLIVLSVLYNARALDNEENKTKAQSDLQAALKPETLRSKREPYQDYLHYLIEKHVQCADQHLAPLKFQGHSKPYDMFVYPFGLSQRGTDILNQHRDMQVQPMSEPNMFPSFYNPLMPPEFTSRRPVNSNLQRLLSFASQSYVKNPNCVNYRCRASAKTKPRFKGEQRSGGTKKQKEKVKPSRKDKKPIITSLDANLQKGLSQQNSSQVVIVNFNVNNCKSGKGSKATAISTTKVPIISTAATIKPVTCSACSAGTQYVPKGTIGYITSNSQGNDGYPGSEVSATDQIKTDKSLNSAYKTSKLFPEISTASNKGIKANNADSTITSQINTSKLPQSSRLSTTKAFSTAKTEVSKQYIDNRTLQPNEPTNLLKLPKTADHLTTTTHPTTIVLEDSKWNLKPKMSSEDAPADTIVASQDQTRTPIGISQMVETTTADLEGLLKYLEYTLGGNQQTMKALKQSYNPKEGKPIETTSKTAHIKGNNSKLLTKPTSSKSTTVQNTMINYKNAEGNIKIIENSTDHSKGLEDITDGLQQLSDETNPSNKSQTTGDDFISGNYSRMKGNAHRVAEVQVLPETFSDDLEQVVLSNEGYLNGNSAKNRPADIINVPVQNNGKFEIIKLSQNVAGSKPKSVRQELDKFLNEFNQNVAGSKPGSVRQELNKFFTEYNQIAAVKPLTDPSREDNLETKSDIYLQGKVNLGSQSDRHREGLVSSGQESASSQQSNMNYASVTSDKQYGTSKIKTKSNSKMPQESTGSISDSFLSIDNQSSNVSESKTFSSSKFNQRETKELISELNEDESSGFVLDDYRQGAVKLKSQRNGNEKADNLTTAITESSNSHPINQRESKEIIRETKEQKSSGYILDDHRQGIGKMKSLSNGRQNGDNHPTLITESANSQKGKVKMFTIAKNNQQEAREIVKESNEQDSSAFVLDDHRQKVVGLKSSRNQNKKGIDATLPNQKEHVELASGYSGKREQSSKSNNQQQGAIKVVSIYKSNQPKEYDFISEAIDLGSGPGPSKPIYGSQRQTEDKLASLGRTNQQIPVKVIYETNERSGNYGKTNISDSKDTLTSIPGSQRQAEVNLFSFATKSQKKSDKVNSEAKDSKWKEAKVTSIANKTQKEPTKLFSESNEDGMSDKSIINSQTGGKYFSFSSKIQQAPTEDIAEASGHQWEAGKSYSFPRRKNEKSSELISESNRSTSNSKGKVKFFSFSTKNQKEKEDLSKPEANDHQWEAGKSYSFTSRKNEKSSESNSSTSNSQGKVKFFSFSTKNQKETTGNISKAKEENGEKLFSFSKNNEEQSLNESDKDGGTMLNSHFQGAVKISSFAKAKQEKDSKLKTEGELKQFSFSSNKNPEHSETSPESDVKPITSQTLNSNIQGAVKFFSSKLKTDSINDKHDDSELISNSQIKGTIKHFTFSHNGKPATSRLISEIDKKFKDVTKSNNPLEGAVKYVTFSITKSQDPTETNNNQKGPFRSNQDSKNTSTSDATKSSSDSNSKWSWIFNSHSNKEDEASPDRDNPSIAESIDKRRGYIGVISDFDEDIINEHFSLENESSKDKPNDMTGTGTRSINYMQRPRGRGFLTEPIVTEIYPGKKSNSRSPPSIYWHTIEPKTPAIATRIKELRPFMSADFEDVNEDFDSVSKECLDYDEIYEDVEEEESKLRPNFPELINLKKSQIT